MQPAIFTFVFVFRLMSCAASWKRRTRWLRRRPRRRCRPPRTRTGWPTSLASSGTRSTSRTGRSMSFSERWVLYSYQYPRDRLIWISNRLNPFLFLIPKKCIYIRDCLTDGAARIFFPPPYAVAWLEPMVELHQTFDALPTELQSRGNRLNHR